MSESLNDPQRLRRLYALFRHALVLDRAQRAAYLDDACGGDTALRDEVASLLAHAATGAEDSFLAPLPWNVKRHVFGAGHDGPSRDASARSDEDRDRLAPQRRHTVSAGGPMADSALQRAGAVLGDYELLRPIDRGGMGVVYKARQSSLNRVVAVKVLLRGVLAGERDISRFRAEAEAAASLQHCNIVPIYQVGEENGEHFFSMAYIEGGSLADLLRDHPLSAHQAARYAGLIARAVQYAHEQGIIHRDLKPSNVLIDNSDQPHVTDFGIARRVERGGQLTQTGDVMGTPAYMPPEQAAARHARIGPASDVYSLGAMLYEMVTGRPPFHAESSLETMMQVLQDDPPAPRFLNPRIPRDLQTICMKCLEKDPRRRYRSAAEFADDLDRYSNGRPIRARPVGRLERALRWCRRQPLAAALSAVLLILAVAGPLIAVQQTLLTRRARTAEQGRVAAQLDALQTAAPQTLPMILENLREYRDQVRPTLRAHWQDALTSPSYRTRLSLAMLPDDPEQVSYLQGRLLDLDPDAVLVPEMVDVVRDALWDYRDRLIAPLWDVLAGRERSPRVLRAASALALYDPDSPRWDDIAGHVVDALVGASTTEVSQWMEQLRPVKRRLMAPLREVFRDRESETPARRALATDIVTNYAADQPETLVSLLIHADVAQFASVFRPLQQAPRDQAVALLEARLDTAAPPANDQSLEPGAQAERLANLAAALLKLGQPRRVWPLLQHATDPTPRSYLVHRIAAVDCDPRVIAKRLDAESNRSARRALVLALGEFRPDRIPAGLRDEVVNTLVDWYRSDTDPGIHASAEWVLRRWGEADRLEVVDAELATGTIEGERRWYLNRREQTFSVIPRPVEFRMGPQSADRTTAGPPNVRITRSFAVATKEVTVREYAQFLQEHPDPRHQFYTNQFSSDPDGPQVGVTWFNAIAYCRWLSELEGVPEDQMCYPPIEALGHGYETSSDFRLELPDDYLERTGYRLATEAEWEFAARAHSVTDYYFGDAEELLSRYAWFVENSGGTAQPVGQLKPNDLGLFDMHGNVREWCQGARRRIPKSALGDPIDDDEDTQTAASLTYRVICGGSFNDQRLFSPITSRQSFYAETGSNQVGIRVARTIKGSQ